MISNYSTAQILELWEQGTECHPLDRALLLLRWMRPGPTLSELADISIGQRDQMLLALRSELFGRELPAYIDCPACRTRLEFTLDAEVFRSEVNYYPIEVNGLRLRQPTSRDLASVINGSDPGQAAYQLAQRCCTLIEGQTADELPVLDTTQLAKIESVLAKIDAAADIVLDFTCTQCAYVWQTPFDISDYLWRELDSNAGKLMNDIHTLARAYGWNEREILELSEVRRAAYLERVWA